MAHELNQTGCANFNLGVLYSPWPHKMIFILMSYLYLWMPLGPDWALLGDFCVPLRDKVGGTGTEPQRMCQLNLGVLYSCWPHL